MLSTIDRVRMCLGLRHCAIRLHMSMNSVRINQMLVAGVSSNLAAAAAAVVGKHSVLVGLMPRTCRSTICGSS